MSDVMKKLLGGVLVELFSFVVHSPPTSTGTCPRVSGGIRTGSWLSQRGRGA